MRKIDLNIQTDIFLLWDKEYKYKYREEDKRYYLTNIISLDLKKDNTSSFIDIFTSILKSQNIKVDVKKEDIFWLFHYFNSVFL